MQNKLRKLLQFSYCLDFDKYCKIFYLENDYYAKAKWKDMQDDFLSWYCDLDRNNAQKFVDAACPEPVDGFNVFFGQYLATLLWSSKPDGEEDREISEINDYQREILRAHALSFYSRTYYYVKYEEGNRHMDVTDLGHDFALTQHHHGAGFWDGDWPKYGDMLTKLSQYYPDDLDYGSLF